MTVGDGSPVPHDTISYSYDTRGNILSKVYSLSGETVDTVTYTYGDTTWADRLTAFDGTAISYDEIGNPLNWINGETLSWQHGRELAGYSKDGTTISYIYNADGIRTSKTVNGVTTQYTVIDGTLRRLSDGTNTLEFINGTSVIFNGTEYWYVFNAQNDVIGLIDASGNYVVEYTYDAWGNPLSKSGTLADTLGTLNPFRYRGYIYDEETGFYYVSSRYYDPVIGRWLNADAFVTTGQGFTGDNMFVYCGNNPINCFDPNGMFFQELFWNIYEAALHVVAEIWGSSDSVGSAQPYIDMPGSDDSNSPNCYAYAIGSLVDEQPGATSGRVVSDCTDVYDVGKSVEADLHAKGFTVRQISGPNGKILENEYRIALRVGTQPYEIDLKYGSNGSIQVYSKYDYHFMRQTDTGCWAEKHGRTGGSVLWDDSSMTPDTIPWTLNNVPYYDSDIIYYAIGR